MCLYAVKTRPKTVLPLYDTDKGSKVSPDSSNIPCSTRHPFPWVAAAVQLYRVLHVVSATGTNSHAYMYVSTVTLHKVRR